MSATTKMMILGVFGGLTSSSDARAHHGVGGTFLVQGLCLVVAQSAIHAARDQEKIKKTVLG
jgi:hypothetical protein